MPAMDDRDVEPRSSKELQDSSDSSEDNFTIGKKKPKLPLVNHIRKGELHSSYLYFCSVVVVLQCRSY